MKRLFSSVIRARTRSPGSAPRTKTTRPSGAWPHNPRRARPVRRRARAAPPDRRAEHAPGHATGSWLSGAFCGSGPPGPPGVRPSRAARVGDASPPDVTGAVLGDLVVDPGLRRVQLPRHARDHHAGLEQQPALEPQGALVVQEVLPPVADDVLGDVDADDVARAGPADAADVVEHRPGDLPVRRIHDDQVDADAAPLPLLPQRLRCPCRRCRR